MKQEMDWMVRLVTAVLTACALAAPVAHAQSYPAKAVRVMIGFPAGSSTDLVGRIAAQKLNESWGSAVVVDNRPGAGANIAAELTAKAPPDGYTLLVAQNALAISRALYPKLNYDAVRDLTPIGAIAAAPHILLVHPAFPAKSVKDLVALAKKRPGELNYGSSGIGINDHMCGELFRLMAGIKVVHVPYKGGNLAASDVMTGQIGYYFAGMPVGLPLHKAGRLRAIAVTSKDRYRGAPELPTIHEAGLTGYEALLWQALFAPHGTPTAIIGKVGADLARARQSQDMRDKLVASGVEPLDADAAQFDKFFKAEVAKWGKVVKDAALTVD
jgi:tripartite-type tricarboxylate transporter receptor subunit TctC